MAVEGDPDDLQLIEGFASLAPIMDCCVVNADGGGTVSCFTVFNQILDLISFSSESSSHLLRCVQGRIAASRAARSWARRACQP